MLVAEQDTPINQAHWTIVQANIDLASTTTVGIASYSADNFAVSSAGVVTIKNNGIILGTETVGDYVKTLSTGTGLDNTTGTGEGSTPNITLDLNELTAVTPVGGDYVAGVDSTNGSTKKFLVSDLNGAGTSVTFDIVGNSSLTSFVSVHSLGFGVNVQVYDNTGSSPNYGETVYVDVKRVATGTEFIFASAPVTGQNYKAVIKQI
jgi:hypothetical protein